MPELADVEVYVERLRDLFAGQSLTKLDVRSPFVVRTFDPDLFDLQGDTVRDIHRQAKRIAWEFTSGRWMVLHLMIAGRLHLRPPGAKPKNKRELAAFHFAEQTLMLTEASTQQRAAIYCFASGEGLCDLHRGGIEPLECSLEEFTSLLQRENHTLKRTLTDPRLLSGIGNAYSDEILHAARLSPLKWTRRLEDDEVQRLYAAMRETLAAWTSRLRSEVGDGFPEKVTAFRESMAVHGRFGQPCPRCTAPVQRIVYASNETNYCAVCQTGGKRLADRSLSRLLKDDWPTSVEGWEG